MRRPTVEEAVAHIAGSLTARYQRLCIAYWREKFGADFADDVRREAAKRLKRK